MGWYYSLKPLSDVVQAKWMKKQESENEKPDEQRDRDLIWFCEVRLKGIPICTGNFRLNCYFTLLRADGKRDRVVEIITNKGERSGRVRPGAAGCGIIFDA